MRIDRGAWLAAAVALAMLGGCATAPAPAPGLLRDTAAEAAFAVPAGVQDYRIGPLDVLRITVFQEPELTFETVAVDATGRLQYPLIGTVQAGGRSASGLADEITARLGERYVRNPQVSVTIVTATSQRVTVEGQVVDPGVYEITGTSTLLQALARAKSPTRVARLDQVVVFRMVDGRRTGAVFDVDRIRAGRANDPTLLGGDIVVVGFSAIKGGFRDFLQTAPFFSLFRAF